MATGTCKINFNNVKIEYEGKNFVVSGNGTACVNVDGSYSYTPGRMYMPNGDPGYPDECDIEVSGIEIEGDIEIDEIEISADESVSKRKQPSERKLDKLNEDVPEDFIDLVAENITDSNCEFDDEDIGDILANYEPDDDGSDAYDAWVDAEEARYEAMLSRYDL